MAGLKAELLRKLFQNIDTKSNNIDLYLFEELPLYLKKEVIESHRSFLPAISTNFTNIFIFIESSGQARGTGMNCKKKSLAQCSSAN